MPNFTPTAEQTNIVNAALTGENVTVKALAGTGKTSTLALIAEALGKKRIAYIAFNKDIAAEASSKMPGVDARTAHSFAYRAINPRKRGKDVRNSHTPSWKANGILGIKAALYFDAEGEQDALLKSSTLAAAANETVKKFCQSADFEIARKHVPFQDGLSKVGQAKLAEYILPFAQKAWELAVDKSAMDFTHDHYLKLMHLEGCQIAADVILFDEAQDANPVIAAIVAAQTKAQVIAVGDENQAIYGFTGAINALDNFEAKHVLPLTKSFRFGPAIAATANKLLAKLPTELRVEGHDPVPSTVAL
jgi:superfamily I DNA/RNA helicase